MEGTGDGRGSKLVTDEIRSLARRAGLLYVLAGSTAPFAYLYVPDTLLVQGDALATADRVRASEGLLRAAIFAELYGATLLVFAALALYQLFKRVDPKTSALMAAMFLVSVPISYVNTLNHIAPLVLLKSPAITAVLDPGQVAAQVTLFLRLHNYGLVVNQIFWGLWLFPIGALVMRSGFIPRWVAWPLFFAGAGYVFNSLGTLLLPPSLRGITANLQILGVGEMPFDFYLLIWGVRGFAMDRIGALLVVLSSAIGVVALVLLVRHRIDAIQYGVLALVSLVVILGAVMRWRSEGGGDPHPARTT
jgi:Domain of unknown function (DUF4386)